MDPEKILEAALETTLNAPPRRLPPELWDGKAGARILAVLEAVTAAHI